MPQPKTSSRGSSSRGTGGSLSQEFLKPILEKPEKLLRRTTVQVFADDWGQTAEDAPPPVTNLVDTASLVGLMASKTSDQVLGNKDGHKSKVVLPSLDLDSITNMVIDGVYELADQVPALVLQFL